MKEVVITRESLERVASKPSFYIVNTLKEAGAPITILRKNDLDVSEYVENVDFKVDGEITCSLIRGDRHYYFERVEK